MPVMTRSQRGAALSATSSVAAPPPPPPPQAPSVAKPKKGTKKKAAKKSIKGKGKKKASKKSVVAEPSEPAQAPAPTPAPAGPSNAPSPPPQATAPKSRKRKEREETEEVIVVNAKRAKPTSHSSAELNGEKNEVRPSSPLPPVIGVEAAPGMTSLPAPPPEPQPQQNPLPWIPIFNNPNITTERGGDETVELYVHNPTPPSPPKPSLPPAYYFKPFFLRDDFVPLPVEEIVAAIPGKRVWNEGSGKFVDVDLEKY